MVAVLNIRESWKIFTGSAQSFREAVMDSNGLKRAGRSALFIESYSVDDMYELCKLADVNMSQEVFQTVRYHFCTSSDDRFLISLSSMSLPMLLFKCSRRSGVWFLASRSSRSQHAKERSTSMMNK